MNSSRRLFRAVLLLALAGVILESFVCYRLERENRLLRQEAGQALAKAGREAASQLAKRDAELRVLRVQVQDLLQLRHDLRLLRSATNDLARLAEENRRLKQAGTNQPQLPPVPSSTTIVVGTTSGGNFVPRAGWTFSGYATPEATLQTWLWSLRQGDLDAFLETLTAGDRAQFTAQLQQSDKSEEEIAADLRRQGEALNGFQIVDQDEEADGSVIVMAVLSGGDNVRHRFIFTRSGTEWKMADAGVDQ